MDVPRGYQFQERATSMPGASRDRPSRAACRPDRLDSRENLLRAVVLYESRPGGVRLRRTAAILEAVVTRRPDRQSCRSTSMLSDSGVCLLKQPLKFGQLLCGE
jgi:hypothetical protein